MELHTGLPLADLSDISGQGYMLTTSFDIPRGCDELEVWFSCTHQDGHTHWNSDFGKNHWLRFGLADIDIETAKVVTSKEKAAVTDTLEFALSIALSIVPLRQQLGSVDLEGVLVQADARHANRPRFATSPSATPTSRRRQSSPQRYAVQHTVAADLAAVQRGRGRRGFSASAIGRPMTGAAAAGLCS